MFPNRRHQNSDASPIDGDSLLVNLSISLAEAYSGSERQLLVNRFVACSVCEGTGCEPQPDHQPAGICSTCHGACRTFTESLLTLTIQPGLDSGSQMRIPFAGHAGCHGGATGDLVIHFEVLPHPRFQRHGSTLTGSHHISPRQARAGAETEAIILGIPLRISILPGTTAGTCLRFAGRGMPDPNDPDGPRGLLQLQIEITADDSPESVSAEARQPSSNQPSADLLLLSPLPAETAAQRLLDPWCRSVHSLPDRTPCLVCGRSTADLLVNIVQHRLFTCGVPISVCSKCSGRFPFSDSVTSIISCVLPDVRAWSASVAVAVWAAGILLLLQVLEIRGGPVVPGVLFWGLILPALAISTLDRLRPRWLERRASRRCSQLQTLVIKSGLQDVFDDDPNAEVMLLEPVQSVQRSAVRPMDVVRRWLHPHQQFRPLFSESEWERSGLCRPLLDTLVHEVVRRLRQLLDEAPESASEAVHVGIVLLPGGRMEVEVRMDSSWRSVQELQAALRRSIRQLPPMAVSCALPMLIYSCNRHGTPLQVQLSPPFRDWSKMPGTEHLPADASPVEQAEQIWGVQPEQRNHLVAAEHIHQWARIGAPLLPVLTAESARLVQRYTDEPGNDAWQERLSELFGSFSQWYPQDPEIVFLHARCLGQMAMPERAAAVCQNLLRRFPTYANAHGFLACLQHNLGRSQDAELTLRAAPRGGLSLEFYLSVARIFRQLNQPWRAAGYLHAAVFRYPGQAQAWLERAQLLASIGHPERALLDLDQTEQLAGISPSTVWLRGQCLTALRQHDAALELYENAAQQDPRNPLFPQLRAELLEEIGRSSEAVTEATRVLEQTPDFLPARILRIHSLIAEGSLEEALAEIDSLPEDASLIGEQHMLRGMVLQQRENFEEALWHFDQACAVDDRHIIRCRRIEVLWRLERFKEALKDLNLVLTDLPDAIPLLTLRGRVQLQLKQPQKAAMDFDRVLQLDPQHVEALHGRAMVFIEDKQPQLAMSLLNAALQTAPTDPQSLMARARLHWEDRELRLAEADLTKLLTHSPDIITAILYRGEIRLRLQRFEDARKDYDHVLLMEPGNRTALICRSILYEQIGDTENARIDMEQAFERHPEAAVWLPIDRLLLQAMIAYDSQQYAEAIAFANKMLALQPDNHEARRCRAASYWFLNLFAEALHDYEQLLLISVIPCQPRTGLLISQAAALGELGEFEQALKILQGAIRNARRTRSRDLARGLNALGRTLTALKRYSEADEAFRESISMEPEDGWLHFNRGLFFLAQGQPSAAGKCFSLARRLTRLPFSPRKRLLAAAFVRQLNSNNPAETPQ